MSGDVASKERAGFSVSSKVQRVCCLTGISNGTRLGLGRWLQYYNYFISSASYLSLVFHFRHEPFDNGVTIKVATHALLTFSLKLNLIL